MLLHKRFLFLGPEFLLETLEIPSHLRFFIAGKLVDELESLLGFLPIVAQRSILIEIGVVNGFIVAPASPDPPLVTLHLALINTVFFETPVSLSSLL